MSASGSDQIDGFFNANRSRNGSMQNAKGFDLQALGLLLPSTIQFFLCTIAVTAIVRNPSLRQGTNLLVANLVASDVLRTAVGFGAFAFYVQPDNTLKTTAAEYACKAVQFTNFFQFFWSMWATVWISYSRYDAIARPLRQTFTSKRLKVAMLVTFLADITFTVIPFFAWAEYGLMYSFHRRAYTCSFRRRDDVFSSAVPYLPIYFAVSYVVPLLIVSIVLFRMVKEIARSGKLRRLITSGVSSAESSAISTEAVTRVHSTVRSKSFRYVVAIVVSNIVLPAPYVVSSSLTFSGNVARNRILIVSSSVIFSANFVVNSLLYCFWIKSFTLTVFTCSKCSKSSS